MRSFYKKIGIVIQTCFILLSPVAVAMEGPTDSSSPTRRTTHPSSYNNYVVDILDKVLGSEGQEHTVKWCIYHNELNVTPGQCWAGNASLRDDIMPTHILGNGLYRLRDNINALKQEYLPSSFQFSGAILDIEFDTGVFDRLVQQKTQPSFIVSRTVNNPLGSNATTSHSFTYTASVQESISLSFESSKKQMLERFSELRISNSSTTHVQGEASASLFGLIDLSSSISHISNKTASSKDQTRTRVASLTKSGETVTISSDTSYHINNTLTAQPGAHIKQNWFVNVIKGLSIPFEARLLVRATRKSNSGVCTADKIIELLQMGYGVEATDISAKDATSILCKASGSMAVSLGLDIEDFIKNL
ncbi:MAG: hypothetical protein IBJ00_00995 [Alphaproteobacteria bacterium]|nr:hypothetical protein [Alphaproteobacteria bacterium]